MNDWVIAANSIRTCFSIVHDFIERSWYLFASEGRQWALFWRDNGHRWMVEFQRWNLPCQCSRISKNLPLIDNPLNNLSFSFHELFSQSVWYLWQALLYTYSESLSVIRNTCVIYSKHIFYRHSVKERPFYFSTSTVFSFCFYSACGYIPMHNHFQILSHWGHCKVFF